MEQQLSTNLKDRDGNSIIHGYCYEITLANNETYITKVDIDQDRDPVIVDFDEYDPETEEIVDNFDSIEDVVRRTATDQIVSINKISLDPLELSKLRIGGKKRLRRHTKKRKIKKY
jgi:hypothetical protein